MCSRYFYNTRNRKSVKTFLTLFRADLTAVHTNLQSESPPTPALQEARSHQSRCSVSHITAQIQVFQYRCIRIYKQLPLFLVRSFDDERVGTTI